MKFLPVNRKDLESRGWNRLDIILITGDAYIDHPAFGAAVIGRYLESYGFKVGVISQPVEESDYNALGEPRLFFGITSGNMDSMVNHYTAQKKIRSDDAFSPDNKSGNRPDRACILYSQKIRKLFQKSVIVLGGIEASLRRIPHYDFWSDKVRNSILFDSRADIIVYGMGEKQILEIAGNLSNGEGIINVKGTVVSVKIPEDKIKCIHLPDFPECKEKSVFFEMTSKFSRYYFSHVIYMKFAGRYLKHNPPQPDLTSEELDEIFSLGYLRKPHPEYSGKTISAFEQIKNSVTSHRGCFGGCNFCAIGIHQGKNIQSRSIDSVLKEITLISKTKGFGGTISDIGGPSANMYGMSCTSKKKCSRRSCIFPEICKSLDTDHLMISRLLDSALDIKGVKHIFTGSGIRYDLGLVSDDYIRILAKNHVSGRLKLAPEHTEAEVLKFMKKPDIKLFEKFCRKFSEYSTEAGRNQEIVLYIMVGHPGETLENTVNLACYLKKRNIKVYQVQEFTPTPMTISSCMYYTGKDFETGESIHIPKGREIRLMKALVQYFIPENRKYIIEALNKTGQKKLIKFFLD